MSEQNKTDLTAQLATLMEIRHSIHEIKGNIQAEVQRAPQPQIQSELQQALFAMMAAQKSITASIGEISIQINS